MNYNITTHLLLVVILEGILVTFLESSKGQIHFGSPPDLSASKSNLHMYNRIAQLCNGTLYYGYYWVRVMKSLKPVHVLYYR